MTQEQVGEILEELTGRPWSKATLSAIERSWDGKRIRRFDADELLVLSAALRVPLPGLLLPPEDDLTAIRYEIGPEGGDDDERAAARQPELWSGEQLFTHIFPKGYDLDNETDSTAYVDRVLEMLMFYWGPGEDTFSLPGLNDGPDFDVDGEYEVSVISRLANQRDALRSLIGDLDRSLARAHAMLEAKNAGRPPSAVVPGVMATDPSFELVAQVLNSLQDEQLAELGEQIDSPAYAQRDARNSELVRTRVYLFLAGREVFWQLRIMDPRTQYAIVDAVIERHRAGGIAVSVTADDSATSDDAGDGHATDTPGDGPHRRRKGKRRS